MKDSEVSFAMRSNQSMLEGPLFSGIIRYTVPIILTSLLQLLFNAADLVVVGQFCGSLSLAAVGATGAITNLIVNLFIGLSVGAGVAVAHGVGSREDELVRRTIHTAVPVAILSGIVLTVVGIALSNRLLTMMGTPDTVLPLSSVYMKIYFSGMTFTMVYNFCAAILRAAGDTKSPLIYLTIAGVVNVILNVFFVRALHMNVAGVALATVVSQAISAVLVVRALMRRRDVCKLTLSQMRIYAAPLKKMIRIGLPAGIQGSLFSISNVIIQSSVNSFGDVLMSGNAAAANLDAFVYVSLNAFQQTAINYIGQNAGARQWKRISQTFWLCLGCVTVVGLALGSLVYVASPTLLSIYITDSPEALAYGIIRMGFVCLPDFLCGLMDVTTGALRGLGASFVPMLICVLGVCGFRIGWIYTIFQLPGFHTPECLYISYPISWIITFLCELVAMMTVYKKLSRTP